MYKRPDPHGQGGAQYVLESVVNNTRTLGISRNFRFKPKDEQPKYYIKVRSSEGTAALALTDEQMQELFYAYFALREEYEDAQR